MILVGDKKCHLIELPVCVYNKRKQATFLYSILWKVRRIR